MSEQENVREDAGLTLSDAIARLERIASRSREEKILAIAYDPGVVKVGSTPSKPIRSIYEGTDFDRNRVFLDVGQRLAAPTTEFEIAKEALRRANDAIGFIQLALNKRTLTPEAKIAAIAATVKSYRGNPNKTVSREPSAS
ncbi:hypothetical protein WT27_13330 [Burkholderia territorii]|uniref:Uncharacterized protein n=1 Tax=Burkholderia territorii TaxID=1503055 RepID=A0A105V469_9BURK|nr:hypothetical protein [Burkholderia territorii]KVV40902.1 hypothetical protein WT27_13330 [Burkholderia territorii]KVX33849.1 hypothetical protein WT31_09230 [Burkholderia territorii]